MQTALAISAKKHDTEITDEIAEKFYTALIHEIEKRIENEQPPIFLGTDYWPDSFLIDILESIGIQISMTVLPCKTRMRIDENKIEAYSGYAAPWETVWSSLPA